MSHLQYGRADPHGFVISDPLPSLTAGFRGEPLGDACYHEVKMVDDQWVYYHSGPLRRGTDGRRKTRPIGCNERAVWCVRERRLIPPRSSKAT